MKKTLASLALAGALLTSGVAAAADKVTVALDWFLNPDHVTLVVARDKGFFAREELEVELIAPADPSAPPRLVAARQVDYAVSYEPELHLQIEAGLPLVRFATVVENPLNTVMVLADGPVKSLADLKGRKIGYSVSGFEDAVLGSMLESVGLKLADVELINVNFALTAALMSGRVDAVVGGFRNFEATEIELAGKSARAFFPEENGVALYDELIVIAHREAVGDGKAARFARALEAATAWTINHPSEAWAVLKAADAKLDDALNARAFADTLPRLAKRPTAVDAGRAARFAAFMTARGLIKAAPAVESFVVTAK